MKKFGFLNMKNGFLEMTKVLRVLAFSALCGVALVSCGDSSGLGPEVDVEAPIVTLTSHKDNTTVPSKFTLKGTASDNEVITTLTVDFDSQNLHYKITPGGIWYKKTEQNPNWTQVNDSTCKSTGKNSWEWTLPVDASEGVQDGNTYSVSAVVKDKIGNSGKDSKVDVTLIMDMNNPDVIIYKPEIFSGEYSGVRNTANSYNLKDGNVISRLWNGDLSLTGRQSGSLSFKELRIEFDNGKLNAGTRKITGDAQIQTSVDALAETVEFDNDEFDSDDGQRVRYFSKTLKAGKDGITSESLRNWTLDIPQSEWVTTEKNAELLALGEEAGAGKVIRIVTTSLSDSLAWERKVVGYFVWWPEADTPWVTPYIGNDNEDEEDYEIYPSANFSGTVQDDDGIESLTYKLWKKANTGEWEETVSETEISISEKGAKYSAFAIRTPTENGNYKITLTVTDINGTSSERTKYFKTLDVSPPKINFTSPENGGAILSSVNSDSLGNITFKGAVSDDGGVKELLMIYLHPEYSDLPENIVRYMGGDYTVGWYKASETGEDDTYTDENGEKYSNKVYKIPLDAPTYDSEKRESTYGFEKKVNIFSDLGIDGSAKTLQTQYFFFRAEDDGGTPTVQQFTLSGDTEQPKLTLDTLDLYNGSSLIKTETFAGDNIPDLPVITDNHSIVLKGTCSDNSTDFWNENSRIKTIEVEFGDAKADVTQDLKAHTWSATLTNLPRQSKTISLVLADFGGNKAKVSKAVTIQTAGASLEKIGSNNDDGSYSANTETKKITINLEFSKNVTFSGGSSNPTLTLNNGGTARYESGNGNAKHVFTYTVDSESKSTTAANTSDKLEKLTVTEINTNNNTWKDSAGAEVTVEVPTESSKNLTSRNIRIDNDKPFVSKIETLTSAGQYKAGSQILVMLEFNENVTVSGKLPTLTFGNGLTPTTGGSIAASASGSKNILFTYVVGETDGGDTNKTLTFDSLSGNGVTVKDEANNTLDSWPPLSTNFAEIIIDTKAPSKPTIKKGENWADIVTAAAGTSFTIRGTEEGAEIEYATDANGTNWKSYTGEVSLKTNGTYYIRARQTDRAGNVSENFANGEEQKVTLDRGDLLTRITADTVSGNYSLKTSTKTIVGRIDFRKAVTIPSGANVTLNIRNGTAVTSRQVSIDNNAGNAASSYTFSYTIASGDYTDGKLDVTDWSFNIVKVASGSSSVDADMKFSNAVTSTNGKRLQDNRDIKIRAIDPTVTSFSFDGTASEQKLTITFDQEIKNKGSGIITLTQSNNDYRVPTVLSVSEYTALSAVFDTAAHYYEKGTNGATVSGSTITSDTDTKYILREYQLGSNGNATTTKLTNTATALVTAFRDKLKRHIVEIPVVASDVSIDGKKLIVNLGENSAYSLPVMGASYQISIPAGIIVDEYQNQNGEKTETKTASGVEPPTIRVMKNGYSFSNLGTTASANVTMPATARVYMESETPGANVWYSVSTATGQEVRVNRSPNTNYSNESAALYSVEIPNSTTTQYTADSPILIGSTITDSTFDTASDNIKGQKFAIAARAGITSATSDFSYEYATRTVLKFVISGNYGIANHGKLSVTNTQGTYTYKNLKVWIIGGDYTHGDNAIETFPLSWGNPSNFKLMRSVNNFDDNMYGKFYWVSWDLTADAYHGFVIGDVPTDANTKGPNFWYAGSYAWASVKTMYILHQGETMTMAVEVVGDGNNYNGNNYRFDPNLLNYR